MPELGLPLARFAQWSWTSFKLASIAALLATGMALLLGFALRLRPTGPLRWSARVVSLGYAVPGAVVAVGILLPVGWLQARFPQSRHHGAGHGHALRPDVRLPRALFVSVALQSVESGYARVPGSIDETARMLGVTGWRLWRELHAPLLRRAWIAALLLVFVDVMKELPATLVLRPFNSDTLAVVAYQLARDERLGEAALPSLAIVLVGLIPVLLLSRSLRPADANQQGASSATTVVTPAAPQRLKNSSISSPGSVSIGVSVTPTPPSSSSEDASQLYSRGSILSRSSRFWIFAARAAA